MANANASTSQSNTLTTAHGHVSLASDIARVTRGFLTTKKVVTRAPLHAFTPFEQNRPLDPDEIQQQTLDGFGISTENIQPDVYPVWVFVDEVATEEAFRANGMSVEERSKAYGPFCDVKTWNDLTAFQEDISETTLPPWIRLQLFLGQHRIHVGIQAVATEYGFAPDASDERLWAHDKWYWSVIIVDKNSFALQDVQLWCMLSHQTSTFKPNDPMSVIRAIRNYQVSSEFLTNWVLDSLGVDRNPRHRAWLRKAESIFANELSELSVTPYFHWFFPRWEYLMKTLCVSNETLSRKLVQELAAEARNRAAAYNVSIDQLTHAHCFRDMGDVSTTIPKFDRVRQFICRPDTIPDGRDFGKWKEFYENSFVAVPSGEKSEFTGEPGCGLGNGYIWTPHAVWGTLPMGFNSRTERLKGLLRVLLYIKSGTPSERVKTDLYQGLSTELGWSQRGGKLHKEFQELWKHASVEGSSVSGCKPGRGFEKNVAAAINNPESLMAAIYSLKSAQHIFKRSQIGRSILSHLEASSPEPGTPPTPSSPSAPSTPIISPHPGPDRPRRLRTAPAPEPTEAPVDEEATGLHRTRKRQREHVDPSMEVDEPVAKRPKKIPGSLFRAIQTEVIAGTMTFVEFIEKVKDYDPEDRNIAFARIAVEGQEMVRAAERARLRAQEHEVPPERAQEHPQEQDKADQADARSRASSEDFTSAHNYQPLIQSLRADQRAMRALLTDEDIFQFLGGLIDERRRRG